MTPDKFGFSISNGINSMSNIFTATLATGATWVSGFSKDYALQAQEVWTGPGGRRYNRETRYLTNDNQLATATDIHARSHDMVLLYAAVAPEDGGYGKEIHRHS